MWIIILFIIGIALIKIGIEGQKEDQTPKKAEPDPPTEDVYILGCCGSAECGYWGMEYYKDNYGRTEVREGVCHCSYQGKTVKEFSKCPYAEKHPDKLRKGIFSR